MIASHTIWPLKFNMSKELLISPNLLFLCLLISVKVINSHVDVQARKRTSYLDPSLPHSDIQSFIKCSCCLYPAHIPTLSASLHLLCSIPFCLDGCFRSCSLKFIGHTAVTPILKTKQNKMKQNKKPDQVHSPA